MKTSSNYIARGNYCFRSEKYNKAIEYYKIAIEETPTLASIARFNIGLASKMLNRQEETTGEQSGSDSISNEGQFVRPSQFLQTAKSTIAEKSEFYAEKYDDLYFQINQLLQSIDTLSRNLERMLHDSDMDVRLIRELVSCDISHIDYINNCIYVSLYPDVKKAVESGQFIDGLQHYKRYGKLEGRICNSLEIIKVQENNISNLKNFIDKVKNKVEILRKSVWLSDLVKQADKKLNVVPYYIADMTVPDLSLNFFEGSIGIHLHLYYQELLQEFIDKLNNIPFKYDLYVSVREHTDGNSIMSELTRSLINSHKVVIRNVPNRGRDIAPFIIEFGSILSNYDIVCHLSTKKTKTNNKLALWRQDILHHLLGDEGRVRHIFYLLETKKAKFVYPESQQQYIKDPTGWADNYYLAKKLLKNYTSIRVDDFPVVEFPEGSMFWARTSCLREFLNLPLDWNDFPEEPIPPDGTLAHALERLLFIFAYQHEGQYIRLHKSDSIQDYRFYEDQHDYSSLSVNEDIQVLAYYLPQFHPIPENDEWHGKGFTEWTKVRSSNPLFEGHYQQHIPHPDIGYYLLNSVGTLKKQADLMHKSGIYGQVFYHYWFTGKLILEEPAQMLLRNPDIRMPFCFCWANENWTRRWDGNENEVLLSQQYSESDADGFIKYLIPFFKDDRYMKVDGRPMLFIYRPSSIPNPGQYLQIWRERCQANGIKPPYMVAVLTRGAVHPGDYGMDAAVERVLHDWTNGNVQDIKDALHAYQSLNGSVLRYDEVADYYLSQNKPVDFTCFRSAIPIWDNTARYGTDAYIIHQSTPEKFQQWLEGIIKYSKNTLPVDRRFIIVNAWNEWAEGAHLEPDTRFGYSYLNSVGRALSGIPYNAAINPSADISKELRVHINVPLHILQKLAADYKLQKKFTFHLFRSTIFQRCRVSIDTAICSGSNDDRDIFLAQNSPEDIDFTVQFRRVALIAPDCIEKMLQTAIVNPSAAVVSNAYDSRNDLIKIENNGSVDSSEAYGNAVVIFPSKKIAKLFKIRPDARAFVTDSITGEDVSLPEVTTIIRFHKSSSIYELQNAILCLAAMQSCIVVPLVAAQDLDKQQRQELEKLLSAYAYLRPRIEYFYSLNNSGDLRSKMLNECIRKVNTRYATFLDYDDLLMPHAFDYLISRLQSAGKAVAFGRVFATDYNSDSGVFLERRRTYEYGYSYDEFIRVNHAPIHSFMLDMSCLDISDVVYYDDQRYMEDYLFTLQVFRGDNVDWDGLSENRYIGDYIHCVNRANTLAVNDVDVREKILSDKHYAICESRINSIRLQIARRSTKEALCPA